MSNVSAMPSRNDPKIAIAYLRVSTDDQKLGPEAQRAMIESWAAREGVQIAAWHVDQGVSGATPIESRPGFSAALRALRTHGAGVLVAAKRDRIARDIVVAASAESAVSRNRATLRTADGTSDVGGSSGMLARGIGDLFAAHEREVIRERTKAALAAKRARGEKLGGHAPYGHRLNDDGVTLDLEPAEQEVIATVRALSGEGMSRRAIVVELARRGVLSRVGRPLQLTQVTRILTAA